MDDRIQTLLDVEEIRNLRILYSHHLDGNHLGALDEVFTQDAVVKTTGDANHGLEELRSSLASAIAAHDRDGYGNYPFVHVITNHWVKLTGKDTAEGRCYLSFFKTSPGRDSNPVALLGVYADAYVRTERGWRIQRSRLEMVWPSRNEVGGEPGKMLLPS